MQGEKQQNNMLADQWSFLLLCVNIANRKHVLIDPYNWQERIFNYAIKIANGLYRVQFRELYPIAIEHRSIEI